uniref:Uncharacterized protein n=1 Tax=Candidatus Kentrum sp. DK TaxID=2126562 RepID=A0A450SI28_9GAMM|nr:MAG: hypothetical protein BECKDK2373C_GA0170839_103814 [Candidatus Kentron sp. DK]
MGTFVVDAELSGAVPIMDTLMGTALRSFAHPTPYQVTDSEAYTTIVSRQTDVRTHSPIIH